MNDNETNLKAKEFERLCDSLRDAQTAAARGYGTTYVYADDVLEGSDTDIKRAITAARESLDRRKEEVRALEHYLTKVEDRMANGSSDAYRKVWTERYEERYGKLTQHV